MNPIILGNFIGLAGKIMLAFTVIMVHHRVWKEHKIDEKVYKAMHRERLVGILGILLMIIGFIVESFATWT